MSIPLIGPSTSLRTRVAIASAIAASAVVAVFTALTTVVLVNNDAAQLDRRLDSIVEASMFPEQLSDPRRGVLTTGRSRSSGQVMFQRGFQLPVLTPGTETVEVNGVEYRVRTIPMDQQGGGVLLSIGIRADSILLSQARIPIYLAVGVLTVLVAAGFGWLLAGPAVRPLRRLTEQTKLLGNGANPGAQMPAVTGAREAEELSDAMAGMLSRL
ncbi:MAG: sensor histidine kinase, partial [Mycobacterium sp.]